MDLKMNQFRRISLLLAIVFCLTQPVRAADVVQLFISAKGFVQSGNTIASKKVTDQKIVNAALDIDPDSNNNASPTRELAVLINCSNITEVVIWDTVGQVPVATIGAVDLRSTVFVSNVSYVATLDLVFDSTNRLLSSFGGVDSDFNVGASGITFPNNCLGFFRGKFVGNFNYIGTGGKTNSVVITSGKASLGAKLGTVP